jgi:hypothetical protein
MLRKTMIVLATAAALTGGLTADAFARGGGFGGGGGGHMGGGFGGGHMGGGFGGGRMGAVTSVTTDVSITTGVSALVSGPAISVSMTTDAATATPITIPTVAICPPTEVRQRQRLPSQLRPRDKKARNVPAGLLF